MCKKKGKRGFILCPEDGIKNSGETVWAKRLVKSVEYNWRSSQGPKVEEVTVTQVSEDVRDNPSCSCKYLITSQGGTVCGILSLF